MKAKTSKILGILLAVLFLMQAFAMTVLPAETATGLVNGDFSQDTEGWTFPAEKGYAELVTDEAIGNKYASILKAKTQIYSSQIPVKAGEEYVWNVDCKILTGSGARGYIRYYKEDGKFTDTGLGGDIFAHQKYFTGNEKWETNLVLVTVPEGFVAMSLVLNAHAVSNGSAVHFDNVGVRKISKNDENLVLNADMEKVSGTMPIGYTVTGDGCTVETTKTHSGSKALKITRETAGTTTVSVKVPMKDWVPYAFGAYMNLESFEDDPENANDGVRMTVCYGGTAKAATKYFVKSAYKDGTPMGWRKMMAFHDFTRATDVYELQFIFTGVGTVYIDDFYCNISTDIIRNGDFEGFMTDYTPAAWAGASTYTWAEDGNCVVLREGNTENHYLRFVTNPKDTPTYVSQTLAEADSADAKVKQRYREMKPGVRYKIKTDIMGDAWDSAIRFTQVIGEGYYRTGKTLNNGTGWTRDYSVYVTCPEYTKSPIFYVCDRLGKDNAEAGVYAAFDNVSISVVDEADTLTFTETDEKVTAVFTGMGEDYTAEENYRKAKVVIARYLVTGDIFNGIKKTLDDFIIVEGAAAKLAFKDQDVCTITKFGEIPMTVTAEFEKEDAPAGASYAYKAFAVDANNLLLPLVDAKSL